MGKWVFCRHKERNTWEIPGGHREMGEAIELGVDELKDKGKKMMKQMGEEVKEEYQEMKDEVQENVDDMMNE